MQGYEVAGNPAGFPREFPPNFPAGSRGVPAGNLKIKNEPNFTVLQLDTGRVGLNMSGICLNKLKFSILSFSRLKNLFFKISDDKMMSENERKIPIIFPRYSRGNPAGNGSFPRE